MILPAIVAVFMLTLIAIHMAMPRFKPQKLSAALFFRDLQSTRRSNRRLSLGNPLRSVPLYIQFPLLILALIALLSIRQTYAGQTANAIGLWVVLDTSASMSTRQAGSDRMSAAYKAVKGLIDRAQSFSPDSAVCSQLSAFDLELRSILPATGDLSQIIRSAEQLRARALGTDLTLVQNLLSQESESADLNKPTSMSQPDLTCTITHVVVVSDQPAPQWASAVYPYQLIWLDIGLSEPNAGITNLDFSRDPLTGRVAQISLNLDAYGEPRPASQVQVLGPGDQIVFDEQVKWSEDGHSQVSFEPQSTGLYTIQLIPLDSYDFDNHAAINITIGKELVVDWQLPDKTLLEQLPWRPSASGVDFRVVPVGTQIVDKIPTLVVGDGYNNDGHNEEILSFIQGHPLLSGLNLDVAEKIGILGTPPLDGFDTIIMGVSGRSWIAERLDPPAIFVPGLPQGDDPIWSFSVTVFFNGVRRLLQASAPPPLYTLTSPQAPEPSGSRLALHPDEGNTARLPFSLGAIDDLRPTSQVIERNPVWPLWLSGLIMIFLVERILFSFGSSRWR